MSQSRTRKLNVLKRRLMYLRTRTAGATIDMSFDKAEASALEWAIDVIEGRASPLTPPPPGPPAPSVTDPGSETDGRGG